MKLTHDEFVEAIKTINPRVEILGKYINATTPVETKCLVDGRVWDAIPRRLLRGAGCLLCARKQIGKDRSLSLEEFTDKVYTVNPNIEIIGNYVNTNTKVAVKCSLDGNVWNARPSDLYKSGCPECGKKKISEARCHTHDEFVECLRIINPNIEVIGTYVNARVKVKVRCVKHNTIWNAFSNNLKKGQGCKFCKKEKLSARALSHAEFVERMSSVNPDVEVVGRYKNCQEDIIVKCKKHDYLWTSRGGRLLSGMGCPKCGIEKSAMAQRLSLSEAVERLEKINHSIKLIGDFSGVTRKTEFACSVCGNKWSATFANICLGHGCPICALSKGEESVMRALNDLNIDYVCQYAFEDCKNVLPLRFDFYIPTSKIAIEYQGIQHYKPIDFAGKGEKWANKEYENNKIRDQVKRDYCSVNGIRLIEIPYFESSNIHSIIEFGVNTNSFS